MPKIIRLKPLNPRKGIHLRVYTCFGITFRVDAGWYEVSDEVAKYLTTVHQSAEADESPPAFDVFASSEDALAHEAAEARRVRERAEANDPHRVHVVTARDAGGRPPREPISQADRSALTTRDLPRADTTDNLPGDEGDLETEDLARVVERASPRPRATRLVNPDDPDTAVEGGELDEGGPPAPATAPTRTNVQPGTPPHTPGRRRTAAVASPKAPEPPKDG